MPFQPYWGPWLVLLVVWDCLLGQELKATPWPLYSHKPALLAWHAPTEECGPRHGVHFQLDQFDIVASPSEGFVRQNLTIFYRERLGLYPYYEKSTEPVNGGLPQVASLAAHLEKMPEGVRRYIQPEARGLAVIDWEEWRPLWIRNWDAKDVYRVESRHLVAQKNPTWSADMVAKVAEQEFELSAKRFFLETLRMAKSLRSNQLWGFYLFPDCYNHNYKTGLQNYTGSCPDREITRNNELDWLWTESTALFPSIYMPAVLRSTSSGRYFVRNRVREAMRLAAVGDGLARPVFVYTRPTYTSEMTLLTEMDLVSTIGESLALGAAGLIFWGDTMYTSSKTRCSSLSAYVQGPLGSYLLNVSTAANLCSQTRCGSRGRCLRRHPDTETYLHLNPASHTLLSHGGRLRVQGQLSEADRARFHSQFVCQCFSGYRDESCSRALSGVASMQWAGLLTLIFLTALSL